MEEKYIQYFSMEAEAERAHTCAREHDVDADLKIIFFEFFFFGADAIQHCFAGKENARLRVSQSCGVSQNLKTGA